MLRGKEKLLIFVSVITTKRLKTMKLTKQNILNTIKEQDMFDYFNCLNMSYSTLKKYYINNYSK